MSDSTTIEEWMNTKTKGHTFKASASAHNQNIVGRVNDSLSLKVGVRTYVVEPGTEYCIFRKLEGPKRAIGIAATFFLGNDVVLNVMTDGSVKRRTIPSAQL